MAHISEQEVEDWLCQHPEEILGPSTVIVGRQIRVPHGILDVLAYDGRILVIELKARPLEEKDLGQVMRYVCDVGEIMVQAGVKLKPSPEDGIHTLSYSIFEGLWDSGHGNESSFGDPVHPVLIGPSIDKKTLAAANGGGASVFVYDEDLQFEYMQPDAEPYEHYPLTGWAKRLSDLILNDCARTTVHAFDYEISRLFGQS